MSQNPFFSILSPTLGNNWCLYFQILTGLALVWLILTLFDASYAVAKGEVSIFVGILSLIGPILLYINNRILYSMCDNSLD